MILSAVCFCASCADITVFSFGRYYLESMHVDEGGSPSPYFHRLDDIADPVVTGKPLSDREKVESLRTRVVADTRQRVDMFGSGTAKKLFLEVSGTHAKYVYERFGHDLKFCHIDENDDRNVIGYACVSVMPSPTFYRWLFGMDGAVRLAKPKGKRWVESFPNAIASDLEAYIQDYEAASEGYKAALDAAISRLGSKAAGNEAIPIGTTQKPILTNSNSARILVPFVCSHSSEMTTTAGHVPTDGYHLSGCTWGNGPSGPRKVARRTRNTKHDRRGERQMPDPGRQHRGRRAFRPQPNNSSY